MGWPLNQQCFTDNILHQTTIAPADSMQQDKVYYDICKITFLKKIKPS